MTLVGRDRELAQLRETCRQARDGRGRVVVISGEFMLGLIEHTNVKTPRWLGYIVQRPEMHCIHHERGVHAYNYGTPIWDMLFGTYRNPRTWAGQVGFWDGASKRTFAMLAGRDVATPISRMNVHSSNQETAISDAAA